MELVPPVMNALPDAEMLAMTWTDTTKLAGTLIGMLLVSYCLYYLIHLTCTLCYRLGMAVAAGTPDEASASEPNPYLTRSSSRLKTLSSGSTPKTTTSSKVSKEVKMNQPAFCTFSRHGKNRIIGHHMVKGCSNVNEDMAVSPGPMLNSEGEISVTSLTTRTPDKDGQRRFSKENVKSPASNSARGGNDEEKQPEDTNKQQEKDGTNTQISSSNSKEEKRMGAGMSPAGDEALSRNLNAKLASMIDRLLASGELDGDLRDCDSGLDSSLEEELELRSFPIDASFDDVLGRVQEREEALAREGLGMDESFVNMSLREESLAEFDYDVLVEESPDWNEENAYKFEGTVIVKEGGQRVKFWWSDSGVENVFITGSFLGNKLAFPLAKNEDGFSLIMAIPPGCHSYEFNLGDEPSENLLSSLF